MKKQPKQLLKELLESSKRIEKPVSHKETVKYVTELAKYYEEINSEEEREEVLEEIENLIRNL